MIKEQERQAFLSALRTLHDDEAYPIGSYVGSLRKIIKNLEQENEELAVSNENLQKEVSVLENKIRTLEKKMFEQRRQ